MNKSQDEIFADALAIVRTYHLDNDREQIAEWLTLVDGCLAEYDDPRDLVQGLAGLFRIVVGLAEGATAPWTAEQLLTVAYDSAIELERREGGES